MLEKMIMDYKIQGSRVDEVLFQEVMKVIERSKQLEYDRDMNGSQVIELGGVLHEKLQENNKLLNQNKRYREALEFYADEENYIKGEFKALNPKAKNIMMSSIEWDDGEKARQTLEELQ